MWIFSLKTKTATRYFGPFKTHESMLAWLEFAKYSQQFLTKVIQVENPPFDEPFKNIFEKEQKLKESILGA